MADYAREEINAVEGYYAFGKELVNGDSVFAFDPTKLSVHTRDIGLAGIEVYDILRDEYDIQIEFGDIGNILAYLWETGNRNWNVWLVLWQKSAAVINGIPVICCGRNTSTPKLYVALSRLSTVKKRESHLSKVLDMCAVNL